MSRTMSTTYATAGEELTVAKAGGGNFSDIMVVFTQSEINAIRNSWASMKNDPSAYEKASVQGTASAFFCQQFYENLLGEFPELKVLFPSIKAQSSAMAGILSLVISQLDNLSRVTDILSSLGKRHTRIVGVEVVHYELVGAALLRTLQDRCGDDFTLELENAWIKLYSYISNQMLQAGEDPPIDVALSSDPFSELVPTNSRSSSIDSRNNLKAGSNPTGRRVNPAMMSQTAPNGAELRAANYRRVFSRKGKKKEGQECVIM